MHGQQCNSCGAYDDSSTRAVNACEHCSTLICTTCVPNHGYLCEELQKRKKRGEGRTIANSQVPPHRRGHESPAILGAPYKLSEGGLLGEKRGGLWDYVNALPPVTPGGQPIEPVDQGLAGIDDLLRGE
jgi:hypothetical protein